MKFQPNYIKEVLKNKKNDTLVFCILLLIILEPLFTFSCNEEVNFEYKLTQYLRG